MSSDVRTVSPQIDTSVQQIGASDSVNSESFVNAQRLLDELCSYKLAPTRCVRIVPTLRVMKAQ